MKTCYVIPLRRRARRGNTKLDDRITAVSGYSCVCRASRERYCLEKGKRECSGAMIIFYLDLLCGYTGVYT